MVVADEGVGADFTSVRGIVALELVGSANAASLSTFVIGKRGLSDRSSTPDASTPPTPSAAPIAASSRTRRRSDEGL